MSRAATSTSALDGSVLVLNKLYMPIQIVSVRRAICLVYKGLAEVVTRDEGRFLSFDFEGWLERSAERRLLGLRTADEEFLHSARFEVQVPRVLRLLAHDRVPRLKIRFNRRNIFARDGNRCQYCGKGFATCELSLDHVLPRSRGGPSTWENIVSCCVKCNLRKGGRTPREAGMRLIQEPVRPRTNPVLVLKLSSRKYQSWHTFLDPSEYSGEPA